MTAEIVARLGESFQREVERESVAIDEVILRAEVSTLNSRVAMLEKELDRSIEALDRRIDQILAEREKSHQVERRQG